MLLTDDLKKKAGIDRKMRRRSDEAQIAEYLDALCACGHSARKGVLGCTNPVPVSSERGLHLGRSSGHPLQKKLSGSVFNGTPHGHRTNVNFLPVCSLPVCKHTENTWREHIPVSTKYRLELHRSLQAAGIQFAGRCLHAIRLRWSLMLVSHQVVRNVAYWNAGGGCV